MVSLLGGPALICRRVALGRLKRDVDPGEPAWTKSVLKSFKSCASLLRSKQQTMLLTLLMGIAGDFHAGRPDLKRRVDAGKAWNDAIDALFGVLMLHRIGVQLSKMARY